MGFNSMNFVSSENKAASADLNQAGPRQELDQLVWFASSALHDLQAYLATVPTITETQLNDLRTIVQQSQSALSKGLRAPRRQS